MIGIDFESKMQVGMLVVLAASLVNYWIGLAIPITLEQETRGGTDPSGFVAYV
jgi:hypothetical protein